MNEEVLVFWGLSQQKQTNNMNIYKTCFSETSVQFYQASQRRIPKYSINGLHNFMKNPFVLKIPNTVDL